MPKTCLIVLGPTAVGKTALGIALAKIFSTQIISADSRQCFRELNVGVAKPSSEQLNEVHHYFINSHSIEDNVNAAVFETYALESVQEIFKINDAAIMVGGTGLYIDAFCHGLDPIPGISPEIRNDITRSYQEHGLGWLQQQVELSDPAYFANGEIQNPQRLARALEVKRSTGKSILEYQKKKRRKRDFTIVKIGLNYRGWC